MSKLISIGELIVDIFNYSKTDEIKSCGGAPFNVCGQIKKLGGEVIYLSAVGSDSYGEFILDEIKNINISTKYIKKIDNYKSSLALISLDENKERTFEFKRNDTADCHLDLIDYSDIFFNKGDIFEFGSVSLNTINNINVHLKLINKAKENGLLIAFDPNLRFNLFEDKLKLKNIVLEFINYCDILKVSKEEYEFLFDDLEPNKLIEKGIKYLLITDGGNNASVYSKDLSYLVNSYIVKSVDSTGAGDSFFGGFLYKLLENKEFDLKDSLDFACICGALTTTGYGAINSMPNLEEILKFKGDEFGDV